MVKLKEKQKGSMAKPAIRPQNGHKKTEQKSNPYKLSSNVVQRYCTFSDNTGNMWTQAKPLDDSSPRQIMVNEKQPATLYIREDALLPGELEKLGIAPTEESVPDPNPHGTGIFILLRQKIIPSAADSMEEIPKDEQTLTQRLFSCCSPPIRSAAIRSGDNLRTASTMLDNQNNYLTDILEILSQINAAYETSNTDMLQEPCSFLKDRIDSWEQSSPASGLKALGNDIIFAVFALYELAHPESEAERPPEDVPKIIQMLKEELEYRKEQILRELATIELSPQIPTECKGSAWKRAALIDPQKKEYEEGGIQKNNFEDIHWPFHFATDIPVNSLTPDSLMIEDAVGKSSSGNEKANAHWTAHIYGQYELLEPNDLDAPNYDILDTPVNIPDCKFNQMSPTIREAYFTRSGVQHTDTWKIYYFHKSREEHQRQGIIEIGLTDDYKFKYTIREKNCDFAAPIDFMIRLAATIVDGLIIEDFALKGFERWKLLQEPNHLPQVPNTRRDILKQMNDIFTSIPKHTTDIYKIEEIK